MFNKEIMRFKFYHLFKNITHKFYEIKKPLISQRSFTNSMSDKIYLLL